MRISKTALLVGVLGLLLAAVGCTQEVSGSALPDPTAAPLALSADGYGIVAGFDDAPVQIEIFAEPQCTHCRDLQYDFGEQLAYYITVGSIQVTYRPLTFLDDDYDGYSSAVVNALFLAAEPVGEAAATGTQFQRFVENLWVNQEIRGPAFSGKELRDMAISAGLPNAVADNIQRREDAVDISAMEEANFELLFGIDPIRTGTPTVYDLKAGDKLDVHDADWLAKLIES
ncbi:MAG: thioredoxin domain-containing protein [Actinomycetia bacterium]|nr:thioredoxin domain-containing protein [Actinomycetes bacterium]MCH9702103.1 thioredoxin domain-containing protein [Actinomycetes bacterium]MCH9761193.1 thioredoxin domain-containing protein [Actinomycetes bacterium]